MGKVDKKKLKLALNAYGNPYLNFLNQDIYKYYDFTYFNDFVYPFFIASKYFNSIEFLRSFNSNPLSVINSNFELLKMNIDLMNRSLSGIIKNTGDYLKKDFEDFISGLTNTIKGDGKGENLLDIFYRKIRAFNLLTQYFPKAVLESGKDFGFHFEKRKNKKITETRRFVLYRINPTDQGVKTDFSKKPVLIIPPYVLGANILAFLPKQNKSYAHSFANKVIPTYIRIQKDINENESVQLMTPEDDLKDTVFFCQKIKGIHGSKITLNGYCQGGFFAVCNVLSGKLDGLVDTLITSVAPMDGTENRGLVSFLNSLPYRYNNLIYGTKTLPNGNKIADGELMSWVYKLNSIETEIPYVSILKKIALFDFEGNKDFNISPAFAAVNYWLSNEKKDLPLEITKFSYDSFVKPVDKDGNLPVSLNGENLNFKRIRDKKIKWLICYGEDDDLVEKRSALAPQKYIPVETASFPNGHIAIATKWSDPESEFALDKRYVKGHGRGPVLFHLER